MLMRAGTDGLRLRNIARALYNKDCDLFDPEAEGKYQRIHKMVKRFLWSQSRKKRSPFERLKWGTYALRRNFVIQMELCFEGWEDEDIVLPPPAKKTQNPTAYMLDLFRAENFG